MVCIFWYHLGYSYVKHLVMANISIIKFNAYSKAFWKIRLGMNTQIHDQSYDPFLIRDILANSEEHVLIDFYFNPNPSIESEVVEFLVRFCREQANISHLYLMGPRYFGEGLKQRVCKDLVVLESNFSEPFFQRIKNDINTNQQIAS